MDPALDRLVGTWRLEGKQLAGPFGPEEHRFEGTVGGAPAACFELISHDAERGVYPRVTYWTRCTLELRDGGRTMTANWEYSEDGRAWRTFWDVRATKETR